MNFNADGEGPRGRQETSRKERIDSGGLKVKVHSFNDT